MREKRMKSLRMKMMKTAIGKREEGKERKEAMKTKMTRTTTGATLTRKMNQEEERRRKETRETPTLKVKKENSIVRFNFLFAGNSEASDDGVMAALALFDSADASKPDPSPRWPFLFWNPVLIIRPRSRLEESDSEIEAIEPEADGNFKNESMMSEEGEEEEEEDYEGEGEEEEEEEDEEEEDEGPPKPVKQPCILVFDSLGGKKDRQVRNQFCHQT